MEKLEKLLKAQDVAEILGVSLNTAKALMPQMHPVNVAQQGNRQQLRVMVRELERWMTTRQQPTAMVEAPVRKPRKKQPPISSGMDKWGRALRMKDGKLVPLPPPKDAVV